MTYETVSNFAQSWGIFYFIGLFVVVLVYALWPKNQERFDRAARMPLEEDE